MSSFMIFPPWPASGDRPETIGESFRRPSMWTQLAYGCKVSALGAAPTRALMIEVMVGGQQPILPRHCPRKRAIQQTPLSSIRATSSRQNHGIPDRPLARAMTNNGGQ
jgi:hypothetical protein